MKQIKKIVAIAIVLVLSIAMIPAANVDAAGKVKLNKKKATIYVGKTVQLKVKNTSKKVKWSSSNKKVATVSKKGKVKGKKAGKATITAKIGKKKYKCKITVKKKPTTTPSQTNNTTPSQTNNTTPSQTNNTTPSQTNNTTPSQNKGMTQSEAATKLANYIYNNGRSKEDPTGREFKSISKSYLDSSLDEVRITLDYIPSLGRIDFQYLTDSACITLEYKVDDYDNSILYGNSSMTYKAQNFNVKTYNDDKSYTFYSSLSDKTSTEYSSYVKYAMEEWNIWLKNNAGMTLKNLGFNAY